MSNAATDFPLIILFAFVRLRIFAIDSELQGRILEEVLSDLGPNKTILSRKWHFDSIWKCRFSKMSSAATDSPLIILFALVRLRIFAIDPELSGGIYLLNRPFKDNGRI